MSANGEPKLKRVKLSLSSPTNDETSVRNVFSEVKSKRKYKTADLDLATVELDLASADLDFALDGAPLFQQGCNRRHLTSVDLAYVDLAYVDLTFVDLASWISLDPLDAAPPLRRRCDLLSLLWDTDAASPLLRSNGPFLTTFLSKRGCCVQNQETSVKLDNQLI